MTGGSEFDKFRDVLRIFQKCDEKLHKVEGFDNSFF